MIVGLRRKAGILEDQDFGIGLYHKLKEKTKMRKKFGVVIVKQGENSERCGSVEYTMTAALANHIMKIHKGPKKNKQEILCNYVNEQMGLKDKCTRVLIELDKL